MAALLHVTGHDEVAVTAGILHDAVEDTDAEVEAIEEQFGVDVGLRRQIAEFGSDATAVYAADKVAKVRELRAQAGSDPGLLGRDESGQRIRHYDESLVMLEDTTTDHPLVCQLRFELEALHALPPRSS